MFCYISNFRDVIYISPVILLLAAEYNNKNQKSKTIS